MIVHWKWICLTFGCLIVKKHVTLWQITKPTGLRMPNILGMCHPLCSVIKSQGRGNWTVSFFVTFCEFQSEENSWIWCVKKENNQYILFDTTPLFIQRNWGGLKRNFLMEFIMKKSEISYPFKKHCIIFLNYHLGNCKLFV